MQINDIHTCGRIRLGLCQNCEALHLEYLSRSKSETSSNSGRWFNKQPSQSSAKDSPESSSWPKKVQKRWTGQTLDTELLMCFFTVGLGECDGKSPISTLSFSEIKSRFPRLNLFWRGGHILHFSSEESFPQC